MSSYSSSRPRVVTVLRGEERRRADEQGSGPGWNGVVGPATGTSTAVAETVYGVPVTAVQSCCGRGCKHCRVYWHRMKST